MALEVHDTYLLNIHQNCLIFFLPPIETQRVNSV